MKTPKFIWSDSIWNLKRFPSYSEYFRELKEKGYTGTELKIIGPGSNFYFYSPILVKLNWIQQPDLLSSFLKELDDYQRETKSELFRVGLSFSALSHRINETQKKFNPDAKKPDPRQIGEFVLDLQEHYRFSDLACEPFSTDMQSILSTVIVAPKKFNLIVTNPEFENLISGLALAGQMEKFLPDRFVIKEQAAYPLLGENSAEPTIGISEIAFALARTYGKEAWYGADYGSNLSQASLQNLFLYRTFVHQPEGIVIFSETAGGQVLDLKELKSEMINLNTLPRSEKKKPIANLILTVHPTENTFSQFAETIVNALLANGYEIRVTFGEILKGADLYYVANSNDWLKDLPFFEELLKLLDHRKSHFYGTVILHPMGEILDTGRWKKIREYFNIPDTEKGWVSDLPEFIQAPGRKILWKRTGSGENQGMSFIRESQVRGNGGEIILSKVFRNETFSLILKSGNHFLINGNFLHLEASYFLSALMGGRLLFPANAYIHLSPDRMAAFSIAETMLKIKLPWLDENRKWRLIHYNGEGKKIRDEVTNLNEIFEFQMKPFELLLLASVLQ